MIGIIFAWKIEFNSEIGERRLETTTQVLDVQFDGISNILFHPFQNHLVAVDAENRIK
jgi:hypothetical protein